MAAIASLPYSVPAGDGCGVSGQGGGTESGAFKNCAAFEKSKAYPTLALSGRL